MRPTPNFRSPAPEKVPSSVPYTLPDDHDDQDERHWVINTIRHKCTASYLTPKRLEYHRSSSFCDSGYRFHLTAAITSRAQQTRMTFDAQVNKLVRVVECHRCWLADGVRFQLASSSTVHDRRWRNPNHHSNGKATS
ncbi:uncharacterized protein BJ212DRAFT_1417044, partial [Suillus subaureus]